VGKSRRARPLRRIVVDRVFSLLARFLKWRGSRRFWQWRYLLGGSSGAGSYGPEALAKAKYINAFFQREHIHAAVELGCGDGGQLELLKVGRYHGIDISAEAISRCRRIFALVDGRSFSLTTDAVTGDFDAALSLDVIYHLVENEVYEAYLERLFGFGAIWVLIYSSNPKQLVRTAPHVLHRPVGRDVLRRFPHYQVVEDHSCRSDSLNAGFLLLRRRSPV